MASTGIGWDYCGTQVERWARHNANLVASLPGPDESVDITADDPPEIMVEYSRLLQANNVILREDVGTYRVKPAAYRAARRELDNVDTLPCGHTGIRNLGDEYTCSFEFCDETFDRPTVKEVYG